MVSMLHTSHHAIKVLYSLHAIVLVLLMPTLADAMTAVGLGKHATRLYRDDPRPSGDVPAGVRTESSNYSGQYPRRRVSKRAQRRLNRRGTWTVVPADIPPQSALRIEHRNLSYGVAGDHQQFDLYLPGGCRDERFPLVIWFPGDDWSSGARTSCPLTWLTHHGFAVASISYRPSPTHIFPAQREDCVAAIQRLSQDAAVWGIDPTRICIVGRAAGAHLATLIGLDANQNLGNLEERDFPVHQIAAICGISTIAHLPTLGSDHDRASSAASRLIGGPLPELREAALRASPISYASPGDPPTLLIHHTHNTSIPVSQSERLHAALISADVDSTLIVRDGQYDSLSENGTLGRVLLNFLNRTLDTDINSVIVRENVTN
jgi:acetyl esterase/lipase